MTERKHDDAPLWTPPPEFLRELPDLIAGKDPELLKPEARAWMLRDPKAREFAQEICGAIAMFADVPARLATTSPEPVSLRAKRSVERAARQLPRRVAEVLWPLLTLELDRAGAAHRSATIEPTTAPDALETKEPELVRQWERLIEFESRRKRESGSKTLPPPPCSIPGDDAASRAARLIAARERLLGVDSVSHWAKLLLHHVRQNGPSRIPSWRAFVRAHSRWITNYHPHVLQTAALAHESAGLEREALELCSIVAREHPRSSALVGAAYSGLKLASQHRDVRAQDFFLRRMQQGLEAIPIQRAAWRRQFLHDAEAWSSILRSTPRVVADLFAILGGDR